MLSTRVRPAVETDRPFLEGACLRAGREMMTAARGRWDEERERQQFYRQLDVAATSVIVHGGLDVGFLMVTTRDGVMELHSLYILPEWQGRGIGTMMTREVVDAARRAGRQIELSVLKVNPRAQALYERLGFRVVSESEHHRRMRFGAAAGG